jgi:protein-S-isoprenylcysteine O-methyltransferase Ste14
LHSLLASRGAKAWAERAVGTRARNGLYRPAYNAIALATTAALVGYVARQEAREVYRVRGVAGAVMRAAQVACAGVFAAAVYQLGLGRVSGWLNVAPWVRGDALVPRETEAQTVPPAEAPARGPFAWCRHPLNFWPVPMLWLNPRMTTKLAAFNGVATAYFYLGSLHSDRRLGAQFRGVFEDYRGRVPLFVPRKPGFPRKNRVDWLFRTPELLENKGKDR